MAITAQDVAAFLEANPGLSDAQIATLANQYSVPASLLSEATNIPVAQIEQRASAAGVPLATGGMMTAAPTTTPTTTTVKPTTAVATGNAGQYGYQNGAPVLNATVAKDLLGNEFSKKIDIGENNQLGWGTNSKYQGEIVTGAGLYGVRGSSEDIQKILSAGETFKQLQAQGKVISSTDPETGTVSYRMQTGIGPDGEIIYQDARNLFNTATREDEFNADDNIRKWQDTTAKLQDAATKLNIPTTGKTTLQILNDVNAADKRIAVVGRTQYWDPAQTNGIGGQGGPQHAAVVYQQVGDKLIPAAPVQTFNFQDPNTTRGFFGDIISGLAEIASVPPISAALAAFGAPFLASSLTTNFGLSDIAAKTIANGLIAGTTTGAITGDAEKALVAALLASGGTYATNSGIAGDALDKIGLGEYKSTLGLLNTDQVNQVQDVANTAKYLQSINGNDVAAIQRGLIDYGVDPVLAASTANQVVSGVTTTQLATDLAGFATQSQGLFTGGTGATGGLPPTTTIPGAAAGTAAGTAVGAGAGTAAGAGAGAGAAAGAGTLAGLGGAANTLGGLLSGLGNLGNLNLGGVLGAGIDFAQLAALQREATGLGRELAGEAAAIGREGAVPFTPYTVTTGAGVGTVGPGGATAVASPEMQALRQQQLGLAGRAFGAVNPAQAAQTLYGQVEALSAPGRAREQEALLAGLRQRGLLGFGVNQPTVGGEVRQINPLLESLLSAQETARAQQALQAQQLGTQEATRQAALGQGLVAGAQGIDQQALAALNAASTLGQQERALASRNELLQAEAALQGLRLREPLERAGLVLRGEALTGVGSATRGLFGLPTQQGNVLGNLSLNRLFGGTGAATSPLGEGTGPNYGFQDYGEFLGGNYILR
jgi:hypothetical protein